MLFLYFMQFIFKLFTWFIFNFFLKICFSANYCCRRLEHIYKRNMTEKGTSPWKFLYNHYLDRMLTIYAICISARNRSRLRIASSAFSCGLEEEKKIFFYAGNSNVGNIFGYVFKIFFFPLLFLYLRTDFLMYGLFKMLCINNCPDFTGAIWCPVWRDYFDFRLACIDSEKFKSRFIISPWKNLFFVDAVLFLCHAQTPKPENCDE